MPITIVGINPVRIVNVGDPAGVVFNRSTVTQAFWGLDASSANREDASILDQNATLAVDGTREIWVAAASGTIAIDYMPTGVNFFRGLTAGLGMLVIPSVFSPDYVPGVAGWSINKDGSAEFNNLTVRGTFIGSHLVVDNDGLFLYA